MIVAVLLAGFMDMVAGRAETAPTPVQEIPAYSTPQLVVPIEKGRNINLVCMGHGSPTVILSAGMGGWSFNWGLVQPALAERTRVCAWDRAGSGFSSPSREPQDIVHTTADLERALKKADIRGPYVMVGHSLGGYESLRFTDQHRHSVVGMVLVDPDIPDRAAVDERLAPQFAAVSRALEDQDLKQRQDCVEELRAGTLKSGTAQFEQCTAQSVPDVLPHLKAAIARLNTDPARILNQASLEKEHYVDGREVINAQRRYGNMPLIVLTAGLEEASALSMVSHLPPATPGAGTPEELAQLREQIARFLREGWGEAHDAYAALSSRGRNQLVPDSGHGIPTSKPEVVISAVNEVLDEIRPSAQHAP
jgi:pimeloyl-ACP methyl ester carboxylesterase